MCPLTNFKISRVRSLHIINKRPVSSLELEDAEMENNIGVRKGAWSSEEDILLRDCIHKFGEGKWHLVPLRAGLNRCRKSCRLRWLNYLNPNLKRGDFGEDEVDLIIRLHKLLGNRWSLIAGRLPGRTANDVKNFWNTHISKKTGDSRCPKTVNRSNIVRPQPRTFSSLQLPLPAWSSPPTTSTSSAEVIKHGDGDPAKIQLPTSSALEEQVNSDEINQMEVDLDECMRWWGNLPDMTENDVHETPIFFSDDDDGGMCQIFQQQPLDPVTDPINVREGG